MRTQKSSPCCCCCCCCCCSPFCHSLYTSWYHQTWSQWSPAKDPTAAAVLCTCCQGCWQAWKFSEDHEQRAFQILDRRRSRSSQSREETNDPETTIGWKCCLLYGRFAPPTWFSACSNECLGASPTHRNLPFHPLSLGADIFPMSNACGLCVGTSGPCTSTNTARDRYENNYCR